VLVQNANARRPYAGFTFGVSDPLPEDEIPFNDSSQLDKRDKTAIRALAKKWLLNGLDSYKPD